MVNAFMKDDFTITVIIHGVEQKISEDEADKLGFDLHVALMEVDQAWKELTDLDLQNENFVEV
jgi:hypothetical protein